MSKQSNDKNTAIKEENKSSLSRRDFLAGLATGGLAVATTPLLGEITQGELVRSAQADYIGSINIRIKPLEKELKPTITLSQAALAEKLDGAPMLSQIRNILARTGAWKNFPTRSLELYGISPIPNIVGIENLEPWQSSFGISNSMTMTDSQVSFDLSLCASQDFQGAATDGFTCKENVCSKQTCTENNCGYQVCGEHGCGVDTCDLHVPTPTTFNEITSYWDSTFVQELATQFEVNNATDLARWVMEAVTRNVYARRT